MACLSTEGDERCRQPERCKHRCSLYSQLHCLNLSEREELVAHVGVGVGDWVIRGVDRAAQPHRVTEASYRWGGAFLTYPLLPAITTLKKAILLVSNCVPLLESRDLLLVSPVFVTVAGVTGTPQQTHLMLVTEAGFGQPAAGVMLGSRSN